jgi:excisionase family DNA binding protein
MTYNIDLTIQQCAEILGYHKESVRRAIRERRLQAYRPGRRDWRVPQREIERFQQEIATR